MTRATHATIFRGATLFDGRRLHPGATVTVAEGRVQSVSAQDVAVSAETETIFLDGGYLAPGFVDLQVNGGGGMLLGQGNPEAVIATICDTHGRLGATTVLPTLVSSSRTVQAAVLAAGVNAARKRVPGFAGLHLEGPHLDPCRAGAHDPGHLRSMEAGDLASLIAAARQLPRLMVTLSPGMCSTEQIVELVRAGVMVSLGHSACTSDQARAAFAAGACAVTHLFNAMGGLHHRTPGLAAAVLSDATVYAGLIADGHHVAPEMIAIAHAARRGRAPRQRSRLFLVSDAMAVAGTDATGFMINGRSVSRRGGVLSLPDGTLAGADYTLAQGVARLVHEAGLPVQAALACATSVPADCLRLADRGQIRPGLPADLVHLDRAFALRGVWRAGRRLV